MKVHVFDTYVTIKDREGHPDMDDTLKRLMKKSDRPRPVRTQTLLPMKLTLKAITEPFRTFRRKPQLSRVFFKKNG